jgi:hypothetical protein
VENTKQHYELTLQEEEESWMKTRNIEIRVSRFDTQVDGPATNVCGLQFGKTTNTW